MRELKLREEYNEFKQHGDLSGIISRKKSFGEHGSSFNTGKDLEEIEKS